jgi:GntR family transcriptional repressor for pyruvate dehydrogenase complex
MKKGDHIAQVLRDQIARGEWKPGERIPSEAELCRQFGVSRQPVRSAIDMLTAQGILTAERGRGTFVRDASSGTTPHSALFMSQSEFSRSELYEFRRIIETETAGLAAVRADPQTIERLKEAASRLENAEDAESCASADDDFHRLLARSTANGILIGVYEMLKESFSSMFLHNIRSRGHAGAKEHRQIILAIESRDPQLARRYMEQHLYNSMINTAEQDMLSRSDGSN